MSREPRTSHTTAGPPVDLSREGDALVMRVALPGLKSSDFRIALVGNRQIHIEGTIPYRHPVPQESLTMAERPHGPFARTVTLPLPVDANQASLAYDRGVLTAHLPIVRKPLPLLWEPMEVEGVAKPG